MLDSLLSGAEWPAFADVDDVSDMELIQGVSVVPQDMLVRASCCLPGCCPERLYHQEHVISAGKPKHKRAMELAPGTTRTKGCHETALYIGLLPLKLGIPPHSLDTRRRRIHSFDFHMPRKTRTTSMTPFVIACECQASVRQRVFGPRHLPVYGCLDCDPFHEACLQKHVFSDIHLQCYPSRLGQTCAAA